MMTDKLEKECYHHDLKSGNLYMVDRSVPTYICRRCGCMFTELNGHLVPVYKRDTIR